MQAHGIMFHHFHNDQHPKGQGAITDVQLADIIEKIGRQNILSAREWLDKSCNNTLRDNEVCLTFDDNLKCQFDIAFPVLSAYKLTAFWFIYTCVYEGQLEMTEVYRKFRSCCFDSTEHFYEAFLSFLSTTPYADQVAVAVNAFAANDYLREFGFYSDQDRLFRYIRDMVLGDSNYQKIMNDMMITREIDLDHFSKDLWMSIQDVKQLCREGHVIGLHTHSHPTKLIQLSKKDQQEEYYLNFKWIKKITGETPQTVSHPCNSYNEDTLDILKSMDVRQGFLARMVESVNSNLEIPRQDHCHFLR